VSNLTESLRSVNKNGVDMYKNHSSNEKNWGKSGEEEYGKYFEGKLSCAGKQQFSF